MLTTITIISMAVSTAHERWGKYPIGLSFPLNDATIRRLEKIVRDRCRDRWDNDRAKRDKTIVRVNDGIT